MPENMTPFLIWAGIGLAVLGLLCALLGWWWQSRSQHGVQHKHIDQLLAQRKAVTTEAGDGSWSERLMQEPTAWLESPIGRQLVAAEDNALLVQAGYQSSQSRAYFLLARIAAAVLLPLLTLIWISLWGSGNNLWIWLLGALGVGFMLPKWFLRNRAAKRRKQVATELPLFVDLLCLLQGAGQGMDQSLNLIAKDFTAVMPVLGAELAVANRLYASGRTRSQAFNRLSDMFQSEALADLTALLVQIDRHGGAVQEPLRRFGERLREQKRMQMKEEIGKITVKMTGIMVVTLLPALMIITAGPGFLAVIRALGGAK